MYVCHCGAVLPRMRKVPAIKEANGWCSEHGVRQVLALVAVRDDRFEASLRILSSTHPAHFVACQSLKELTSRSKRPCTVELVAGSARRPAAAQPGQPQPWWNGGRLAPSRLVGDRRAASASSHSRPWRLRSADSAPDAKPDGSARTHLLCDTNIHREEPLASSGAGLTAARRCCLRSRLSATEGGHNIRWRTRHRPNCLHMPARLAAPQMHSRREELLVLLLPR